MSESRELSAASVQELQELESRLDSDDGFKWGVYSPLMDQLRTLLLLNGVKDLPLANIMSMVCWWRIFQAVDAMYAADPRNFFVINSFGDLVQTDQTTLFGKGHEGQLQRLFDDPIHPSVIKKYLAGGDVDVQAKLVRGVRALVLNVILQHIKTHRQASTRRLLVDPFVTTAVLTVGSGEATYTRPLELPDSVSSPHIETVLQDFTEHFPEFSDFIDLLCAARFAPDRRQAFLWLQCQAGWGKSMLLSALNALDLVVEVSGKEAEACFEGKPVGLDPNKLARAWVLAFDEARYVKTETKQLARSLHLTPKYNQRTEVPVYLKLFISAEDIDSLAGSEGVETQFADRFSYMSGTGRVEERALFKELGGGAYVRALAAGIAHRVTRYADHMRHLGRDQAEKYAEQRLKALHAQYKITLTHTDLEDTLVEYTEELKVLLREYASWRHIGPMPQRGAALAPDLLKRLESSVAIGWLGGRDERIEVICLKRPQTFVSAWLATLVNRSELTKVSYKAREICRMVSEMPIDKSIRLHSTPNADTGEVVKGMVVNKDQVLHKGNIIPMRTAVPSFL